MRTTLLAATLALFGFTAVNHPGEEGLELRISTPRHGVEIEVPVQTGETHVLAGPQVSIILPKGAAVRVNDLDSPEVSARIDWENEWTVWEGSYEVEVVEGDEVTGRFRVREATMVLGRFEGDEGWMTEGE